MGFGEFWSTIFTKFGQVQFVESLFRFDIPLANMIIHCIQGKGISWLGTKCKGISLISFSFDIIFIMAISDTNTKLTNHKFLTYLRFLNKPSGNVGIYDPAEIHNRSELKGFLKESMAKLGFHLISFFLYLYRWILYFYTISSTIVVNWIDITI